jgi:WD40 repeat protein
MTPVPRYSGTFPPKVVGVAFGPSGTAIAACDNGSVQVWDLKTGKNTGVFEGHIHWAGTVAWSEQARLAATCGADQTIRLWNLETGKEVRKLTGDKGSNGSSICFSPDGKHLLSISGDYNTLCIWDVATGAELKRINAPNAFRAAYSPDGKRIVAGGFNDTFVRLYDTTTGKELQKYKGHTGGLGGVAFFPDGKHIASAGDNTVRIWQVPAVIVANALFAQDPAEKAKLAPAEGAMSAFSKLRFFQLTKENRSCAGF